MAELAWIDSRRRAVLAKLPLEDDLVRFLLLRGVSR